MTARVLFFGATADIAGQRVIEIEPDSGATAASVLESLISEFPAFATHKLKVSINQTYAAGSDRVKNGDEIAIFTAVSGG